MSHFKGKDGGAILYKKFDDKRVVFDGDFKEVKQNCQVHFHGCGYV